MLETSERSLGGADADFGVNLRAGTECPHTVDTRNTLRSRATSNALGQRIEESKEYKAGSPLSQRTRIIIQSEREARIKAEAEIKRLQQEIKRRQQETKRSEAEAARRRREAALEAFDAEVEHRRATLAAQPRFGVPRVAWGLPATRGARVQEHWRTPQAKHENTSTKHGVPRGSSPQGTMPQDYGSNM